MLKKLELIKKGDVISRSSKDTKINPFKKGGAIKKIIKKK
jgi:hypothetical protein